MATLPWKEISNLTKCYSKTAVSNAEKDGLPVVWPGQEITKVTDENGRPALAVIIKENCTLFGDGGGYPGRHIDTWTMAAYDALQICQRILNSNDPLDFMDPFKAQRYRRLSWMSSLDSLDRKPQTKAKQLADFFVDFPAYYILPVNSLRQHHCYVFKVDGFCGASAVTGVDGTADAQRIEIALDIMPAQLPGLLSL
jgi:hypothetical protein